MKNINKTTITLDLEKNLLLIIDRKRISGIVKVTRTTWIKDAIMRQLSIEDFKILDNTRENRDNNLRGKKEIDNLIKGGGK